MVKKKIAVLAGDGIGPEVMEEGLKVLKAVAEKYRHHFDIEAALVGGIAYGSFGEPLPKETIKVCENSDAIYFGSVGGPKWDKPEVPKDKKPEKGILGLRKHFELFANLRPAVVYEPLADASSLKKELVENLDILIVRELTGGIYFGEPRKRDSDEKGTYAIDTMKYYDFEIERIAKVACEAAMERKKMITSVDKANVVECSRLWRERVTEYVTKNYPEIKLEHMYVDNASMQLATNPKKFDVIVTENMFGDILSDEAAAITGSIGMLPSASLNEKGFGLYEPAGGSAPDIAGKGIANPLAQILSLAMMLRYSFGMKEEANAIQDAVLNVLKDGYRTPDIAKDKSKAIGTAEMGDKVVRYLMR